jgi:hypothetical protein
MLAALAIIGLAMGGLMLGVSVLSNSQLSLSKTTARLNASRLAAVTIERALAQEGAFRAQGDGRFSGRPDGFQYACNAGGSCSVALGQAADGNAILTLSRPGVTDQTVGLHQPGPLVFTYRGATEVFPAWPPRSSVRQALRAISLAPAGTGTPLFVVRLWAEQPAACDFDPVMQDCR